MVSPAALDAASEFIKDFGIGFCGGLREVIEIARRQVSSRTMSGFFLRGLCAPRYAEVIMLCCAERGAWRATNGGPKRLILSKSNVEGVKAHDDFTSSVLGNDVILDARRRVAGISDLARWNWCR
jgi:hypothetical protein